MWVAQTDPMVDGEAEAALSTQVAEVAASWKAQGVPVVEVSVADFERDADTHSNVVRALPDGSGLTLGKRLRPPNPRQEAIKAVQAAIAGLPPLDKGRDGAILKALEVLLGRG